MMCPDGFGIPLPPIVGNGMNDGDFDDSFYNKRI